MIEVSRTSPSMVVAAYAQSFVEGRKVVVFGDSTSGLAEVLVDRGARLVHVYDRDVSRVAEATARGTSTEIAFAPLGQSGVAVRDGAFDVGIIENLAAAADPSELMTRVRRALAARGVALVLCPNVEADPVLLPAGDAGESGPTYYEIYDIVSREFDEVRMVGQTPFVGYALADFTPGVTDEFSIDTGFIQGGAEEPEWYLAVASHFPVAVDPFNVVQLPAAQTLEARVHGPDAGDAEQRAEELSRELAQVRQQLAKDDARELLLETKRELEKRDAWVYELEGRAAAADTRADEAEARADEAEARLEDAEGRAKDAEGRAKDAEGRAKAAEARAAAAEARAVQAEKRAAAAEAQAADAKKQAAHADERAKGVTLELSKGRRDDARSAEAVSARAQELEVRLKEMQRRLAEAESRLADAAEELRAQEVAPERRQEMAAIEGKLTRVRDKLDQTEQELRLERDKTGALSAELEATERQLRERGQAVAQLQRELVLTERLAAELLAEREPLETESEGAGTNGQATSLSGPSLQELQANLDELAQVDARRVADLTAAQWTVQELENRLADQQAEARADIERLRAELQQQATLLAQAGKAPSA